METRILVGVDFSAASDRAVEEARMLARKMGAQLDFVYISPIPVAAAELPPLALDVGNLEQARKSLAELQTAARRDGLAAEVHFGIGSPVFGLLDFIRKLQPALVVVGSHGRNALARLFLGSVAESLVRRATVPVLVVPAPERVKRTQDSAWSCRACGHILGDRQSSSRCAGCGAEPAHWTEALISSEPIDAGEPSVGDEARDEVPQRNDPAGLFAISPPGTEGADINPELRVRY